MKKILSILLALLISVSFAASTAKIRVVGTASGFRINEGANFIQLEANTTYAPTSSAIVFYLDNIAGYNYMLVNGFEASSGNIPTTVAAVPVYSNGYSVSASAQTLTAGTATASIISPFYKITLPAASVTRNVSFNYMIYKQ